MKYRCCPGLVDGCGCESGLASRLANDRVGIGRCIGGHGTLPYEQKTQQWPGFGRSSGPQRLQS
jgi:hypothetical protein